VSKNIVTIEFEVSARDVSDLQDMQRDGALDDLVECLATLKDRRVVGVAISD
jgi:hypothetical protein